MAWRRRQFLGGAVAGASAGVAGCLGFTIVKESRDSDEDGVNDAADYAPRDPDVQNKSDVGASPTPDSPGDSFEDGAYTPEWTVERDLGTIEIVADGMVGDRSLEVRGDATGTTQWVIELRRSLDTPVTFGSVFSTWVKTDRIGPPDLRAYQLGDPERSDGPYARIAYGDGTVLTDGDAVPEATLWADPAPDTWYEFELEVIDDGRIRFGVRDTDGLTVASRTRGASANSAYTHELLRARDASDATPAVWFDNVGLEGG